jgi:hypothetical protein
MASLAEIRARIAAQQNKSQKGSSGPSDNAIYPHWNMDEGTTATLRFLPDGDDNNPDFWVERQIIKLPFNGIKGETSVKRIEVQVPCIEMYGKPGQYTCPILTEVRAWYKDESLKEMANKYWKKRSYLFQGFVRQNPIGDDKVPTNPIRRFIISPQIIPIIKSGLMDPEIIELPTDYVHGLDFNIKKTSKGGYADYSTSNWARRETPLTEQEQEAIQAHGLFKLSEFLPKKPGDAELKIMKEMFEASVEGQAYDPDKWGQYYKPYGLEISTGSTTAEPTAAENGASVKTPVESSTPPWEDEEPAAVQQPVKVPSKPSSDKAADILAMIKARQNKSA